LALVHFIRTHAVHVEVEGDLLSVANARSDALIAELDVVVLNAGDVVVDVMFYKSRVLELLGHLDRAVDETLEVVFADVAHAIKVLLGEVNVLAGVRLNGVRGSVVDCLHLELSVHLHECIGVHTRRGHQIAQTRLQGALEAAVHVEAIHSILHDDRARLFHVLEELGQSLCR
ncbi:hypothetical protein PENTCL1PPCAC_4879, partial [Pristionchus entomophagus]